MKKITLLFLMFLAFTISNAQNTCAMALPIVPGSTTTVGTVDGELPNPDCAVNAGQGNRTAGEWYTYTAGMSGIANISSNLPANMGLDTRVSVYTGTCGNFTCVGGGDDVANDNFLTDLTFAVTSGVIYYIAWDNQWSATGFDFTLTETAVDCSTDSPYVYDFTTVEPFVACYTSEDANTDGTTWGYNSGNDFDGDAVDDGVGLIFPQAAGVVKDDWLYLPVFNGLAGSDYTITVVYNTFNNPAPAAEESFDIVALDSPSSTAASQTVLGTYSGITQSGELSTLIQNAYSSTVTYTPTADGDFYFAIHSTTPAVNSGIIILFNISVDTTLSVNEFDANIFTHSYNKDTDKLTLNSSTLPLSNLELYNILGQRVLNNTLSQSTEIVDMSSLKDGVYLAKVIIQGQIQTLKILKQ